MCRPRRKRKCPSTSSRSSHTSPDARRECRGHSWTFASSRSNAERQRPRRPRAEPAETSPADRAMQRRPLIRKQPRGAAWVPDQHEREHNEMVVVLCRLVWGRFVHSSDDRTSQQPVHLPEEIECGAPCTGFQEDLNQRK